MNTTLKYITPVLLFTLAINNCFAQSKKVRPISIGDKVPDIEFKMINYKSPTAKLSDFKGKLVLMDFWASWCFSCVLAIPKLSEIQNEFSDKVQIIYVNSTESTGDKQEKVQQTVKKYSPGGQLPFLISYNDSIAYRYFPHFSLPHYVWITPNGFVKAITDGDQVTAQNIKAILENENVELSLPVKLDYIPNKLMDLGLEGPPVIDEDLSFYSVFKKGKLDGLSYTNDTHETPEKNGTGRVYRGIALRNVPLLEIFQKAAEYLRKETKLNGDFQKRLILDIKDSSKLFYDRTRMSREEWEKENLYTYELVLPEDKTQKIDEFIWRDVNLYTGFTIRIENRNRKCYIITAKDNAKTDPATARKGTSITTKDGIYHMENVPIQTFASFLDKNPRMTLPVITTITKSLNIDLSFDYEHLDLGKLRKQLAPLGLDIKESISKINVMVVNESK